MPQRKGCENPSRPFSCSNKADGHKHQFMSKTTLGITLRESSKKKDGTSPVMFSISQDGVTRYYPAGVDCKAADWKIINSLLPDMIEDEFYETIQKTLRTRGKRFAKLVKTLEYFDFVSFAATWEKNKSSIYLPEDDAQPEEAPNTNASERMKVLTKGIPDVFKVYENVMVTKKKGTKFWYNNGYKALKRYLGPEKEYLPGCFEVPEVLPLGWNKPG